MPDGRDMESGMEDKAVSTGDDSLTDPHPSEGKPLELRAQWNILLIEKILTSLINNKLTSIREMEDTDSEKSSCYFRDDYREREHVEKTWYRDHHRSSHQHHHHHRHRQSKNIEEEQQQRSSISKVQNWSDDLEMETSFANKASEGDRMLERSGDGRRQDFPPKKRRKKRKKFQKKISHIDPEDLPKRARWTIIITAGLLILTCMFLVGITLRMAPVIDQMVRTKNEELMNSLNRNSNPAYYSSIGTAKKELIKANMEKKLHNNLQLSSGSK